MALNVDLLRTLCITPGAPGREERIREVVRGELRNVCDEVTTDNLGNVIGLKKATSSSEKPPKRLMLASHIDEISLLVTHIDDRGFVRFIALGGFDPKTLTAQRVWVHGKRDLLGLLGSKPIHIMTDQERNQAPKLSDYFIDLGLPAEEVRKLVSVGDVITRERELVEVGTSLSGKSFDNRIGVFVMLEAVKRLESHEVDLYAVASVQEEIGLRGATVAARNVDPDIGLALDTTVANDVPEAKEHEYVTRLGDGAAVKVMDSSVVCHPKIVAFLERVALEQKIPHQREVLPRGGTDTAALQRSGKGAAAGCVSVPTRYVHSVIEMCSRSDVEAAISLVRHFIEGVHAEDLSL